MNTPAPEIPASKLETLLAQAGSRCDPRTGAITAPIYQCATFRHPALGESTGFDYSRTANPTRSALEETLAALDGGARACAFSSGLAALDAIFRLFRPGDRLLASEDLYGGTFRMLEKLFRPLGIETVYADTSDTAAATTAIRTLANLKGVLIEVPTNPLLKVADVRALADAAHAQGALLIVDNTFLTPVRMRPLALGADLVAYSATKYLGGHNDVVAGAVVAKTAELGERIGFLQNAAGAVLGPQDAWLLLRGLKTLSLRLQRQEENAQRIAEFLAAHPRVRRVYYPGLPSDPGHARLLAQAGGGGGMIAFEIDDAARVPPILAGVRTILFAESLGGVESLMTYPAVQTHADIAPHTRERLGINDRLLRLSVGIESADDLLEDLRRVLD